MTKLIYAASLLLVLAVPDTFASAQGERELMQQWLDSQCQVNPGSPLCRQAFDTKQPAARLGTFHPYPGPMDLCPAPEFRLDLRDGCVKVGLHRVD
jgi:hypothetical protein